MFRVILSLFLLLHAPYLWSQKQGICGNVVWEEGNRMPGPQSKTTTPKKIQRELYFYEPVSRQEATMRDGLYTEIRAVLVKTISTGPDGTFKVDLPPGEYSLFSKEDEGFFANIYDASGRINVVEVKAGKFTEVSFRVNYKAFY
ncbi:MAG TPA: carboxypeptidase regulatory-like domain-containing protein [Chryseosolibacter sp.]|nr:carboxypeptidase regulatory-like domain-containing protein [Chryseosolibacter sp.]